MPDDGALTLQPDLAEDLRMAAEEWGYESADAVVREALTEWRIRQVEAAIGHAKLKAMIQEGLDDIAAGRVYDFDADEIIREAKERRARRCA